MKSLLPGQLPNFPFSTTAFLCLPEANIEQNLKQNHLHNLLGSWSPTVAHPV